MAFRALSRILNRNKPGFDKYIDPGMFWIASNLAYIYGGDKAMDFIAENVDKYTGLASLATLTGLGIGMYGANKYIINPVSRQIHRLHQRRQANRLQGNRAGWIRTAAQTGVGLALYALFNVQGALGNFRYDGERILNSFARESTKEAIIEEEDSNLDITPESLENMVSKELDMGAVRESNKFSTKGRFLRTYRWDQIIADAETRHSIEPGLLAGLAMRESYGNPLELNSNYDGGAGLYMFQPGTARRMGLKIFGNSRATGRDRNHGLRLKHFVAGNRWDYDKLARADERFDVEKSSDAAARYLRGMYDRHGSWDAALSAYNRGNPVSNPRVTSHVKMTRAYQRHYLEQKRQLGSKVGNDVLAELRKENDFDFSFVNKNSTGKHVFRYNVRSGDNATLVADNFNRWDDKSGDSYHDVDYAAVSDNNGKHVGSDIHPGRQVYVLANKK